MRDEAQFVRGEDQCIARDAGHRLIRAGEAAVDHQQLAAGLDRALALAQLHRHMAVDDEALVRQVKLMQDAQRRRFVVLEAVIGVLDLYVRLLVLDEVALERRHLALAKQRGVRAAAQVPQEVLSVRAGFGAQVGKVALARHQVRRVDARAAAERLA